MVAEDAPDVGGAGVGGPSDPRVAPRRSCQVAEPKPIPPRMPWHSDRIQ